MLDKEPIEIVENDLLALISDKEPEGKTIDYKIETIGLSDGDRKEFLYDVSSFANARGGYLVFGMEEVNGLPTKLVGLPKIDPDREILRLEQIARDGIRPPITGLQTPAVKLSTGNRAIVMRIPKSWNPPHQVTFQKAFRFYSRDSNGKYQIDVDELRSIFVLSTSAAASALSGTDPFPLGVADPSSAQVFVFDRRRGRAHFNLETAVGRCEVHSVSEISRLGCIRLGRGGAGRGGGVR